MKLLVDTKAGRVLYVEASKDAVDFPFYLFTMAVGTGHHWISSRSGDDPVRPPRPYTRTPARLGSGRVAGAVAGR